MLRQATGYIFIWAIIGNFHRTTHLSLIQAESYQQTPNKTKNNGEHKKREHINTLVF